MSTAEEYYYQDLLNEASMLLRIREEALLIVARSPAYNLKPKLFQDGDQWCALYGKDIQGGVSGFGNSPAAAFEAFDLSWHTSLTP